MLKRLLQLLALSLAACASLALAQKTPILVYTALETDQLKAYKDGFEKGQPDVEIRWVRDSTGVITAKLLAEKANPQADVVLGLAATSLADAARRRKACCTPYAPKGLAKHQAGAFATAASRRSGSAWTCGAPTICFNTVEAQKREPAEARVVEGPDQAGLQGPDRDAATRPPRGTGYLDVSAWLQMCGEAEGWKYMDALHENIAQYTHSGSKPCRQAGAGEFAIGISFEYRANRPSKATGAPIDLIFPKEGLGWDMEAIGDHEDDQEAGGGEEARRLGGRPRRRTSSTPRTSRSWRCPASRSRCRTLPPTTRSCW